MKTLGAILIILMIALLGGWYSGGNGLRSGIGFGGTALAAPAIHDGRNVFMVGGQSNLPFEHKMRVTWGYYPGTCGLSEKQEDVPVDGGREDPALWFSKFYTATDITINPGDSIRVVTTLLSADSTAVLSTTVQRYVVPGGCISAVSGHIANDSTVVITGDRFKTKSPAAPLVWDNFESGANEATLGEPSVMASGSAWSAYGSVNGTPDPYYSTQQAHSGTKSAKVVWKESGITGYSINNFIWTDTSPHKTLFLSYYRYHDPSDDIVSTRNIKQAFVRGAGPNYANQWLPANSGSGSSTWKIAFQPYPSDSWYFGVPYASTLRTWDRWDSLIEYETNTTSTDGHIALWLNNSLKIERTNVNTCDPVFQEAANACYSVCIGYMFQGYADMTYSRTYYDDVYIDDTLARIEIGDNAVFADCTHREIQIPSAWSNTEVTVTINQGTFTPAETAYLFVIDSNGDPSDGYEVVWE